MLPTRGGGFPPFPPQLSSADLRRPCSTAAPAAGLAETNSKKGKGAWSLWLIAESCFRARVRAGEYAPCAKGNEPHYPTPTSHA